MTWCSQAYILVSFALIFLFKWFVLEIHGVMSLVVKESFPLKEVLSPLEGTLLLHLLETVFIRLQNVLGRVLVSVSELLLLLVHITWILIFKVGRAILVFGTSVTV